MALLSISLNQTKAGNRGACALLGWGGRKLLFMATLLSIANSALIKLGAMPVTDLGDGSKESNICQVQFPIARDYVLGEHGWKCCTTRVQLSPLIDTPIPDGATIKQFGFAYQLPVDFIRTQRNNDGKVPYLIENKTLFCNMAGPILVRYVCNSFDPSYYTPDLAETIAWYLAQDIALNLVQNSAVADRLSKKYDIFLSKAKFKDSSTSKTDGQQDHFFEQARLIGNFL